MQRTPLFQVQLEHGASFISFGEWEMPVRFESELSEHSAVRTGCGIFDVSHMGQIRVSGKRASEALDFALVTEPSSMATGQAKYSMICNSSAGIIDDLIVYRLGDSEYLLVANASNAEKVLRELHSRLAEFEVSASFVSPSRCLLAIQGPSAIEILNRLDLQINDLGYYRILTLARQGHEFWIARTGYTGEDGFEISLPASIAAEFWLEAVRCGVKPCGLAARDTLRLEAGMPLYGHELREDLTPYDVGMSRVVKLNKNAAQFGQDALELAAENNHWALVGLSGQGRRAARAGYSVLADGSVVGEVTSGSLSPTLGKPIAMALVSLSESQRDVLQVDVRGEIQEYKVVKLPFYKRAK